MTGLLKRQWRDHASRRRLVMLVSGALLLLGLGAGAFVATAALRDPLLAAAAMVAGADIARRAFDGLRRRQFTIDLLVTIAAVGALVIGEAWEAAAVTFLFVFGAWLEARTLGRTRQALSNLLELAPVTALVMRGGEAVEVDPTEVRVGETVMVRPGARIPVDGIVREGRAAVDESAITGEPMPVEKGGGDAVYAGTVSRDGMLMLEATGVGADTTLARIVHRVEEAQDARAPVQRTIERFAGWYTPSIIVLAALAGALTGEVELALTLLVIGCPGAMVIATPVAIVAGIGRAAGRGILIKGGEYLETIGRVGTVAFDKTGTLTRGKPVLTDVVALRSSLGAAADSGGAALAGADRAALADAGRAALAGAGRAALAGAGRAAIAGAGTAFASAGAYEDAVLRWAAIAETGSAHPLAPPIVEAARAVLDEPIPHPEHGEAVPGKGIRARWQGHAIDVGTPALLDDLGIALDAGTRAHLARLQDAGKTAMLVAVDGEAIGLLGVTDVPRASAAEVTAELRRIGVRRLAMLSGDNPRTAAKVAQSVGIDEVRAGILPEGKLEWIRARQAEGEVVAMVGDGINDAPALAAADVGIAMGAAGSDIALETADVALMADQLERIPEALRISRATVRVIRQNLVIALLTVAALLAGVLAGHVDMAGGMLVHQGSVLVVILNAMRLMRA